MLNGLIQFIFTAIGMSLANSPLGKVCGYMSTEEERAYTVSKIPESGDYSMRYCWNLFLKGGSIYFAFILLYAGWTGIWYMTVFNRSPNELGLVQSIHYLWSQIYLSTPPNSFGWITVAHRSLLSCKKIIFQRN